MSLYNITSLRALFAKQSPFGNFEKIATALASLGLAMTFKNWLSK